MAILQDADSFEIGTNESKTSQPLGCNLVKLLAYMKKTGKKYEDLTITEKNNCK